MTEMANLGITQKVISHLCGLSHATVNRYIAQNNIDHIPGTAQRNLKYAIRDVRNVVYDLFSKNVSIVKKRQGFYNFKGGTGKTSLTYQVSSHLALMGFRVLVVDADPQGHLSTSFGFDTAANDLTLYDVIAEFIPVEDVISNVFDGLDCIPSNLSLTRIEVALNQMPKREEQLMMCFKQIEAEYDFVFFDTNPTISLLNRNVIAYADQINIVCETQPYSLNGLSLLLDDIGKFFKSMRMPDADVFIIPNKYEDRMSTSAEAMSALRANYSQYLKPDFAVRKSEDINISAKNSLPLAFFAKSNSNALEDIIEVVHHILLMSSSKGTELKLAAAY